MAQINEVLTAASMSLSIYCGNQSRVGVGITGTWVGTLYFYGSSDGINFQPIGMQPFASGTAVTSTTANGNWWTDTLNYVVVKVAFVTNAGASSYTSGSAVVQIGSSTDSAYQKAFLTAATVYVNSQASAAVNTLTQTAQANRAWKLKTLTVSLSAQPAWLTSPNLQIKDGTTVLMALDLPPSGSSGVIYSVPLSADGIVGTAGNSMVIVVANPQGSAKSNINAEFSAQ